MTVVEQLGMRGATTFPPAQRRQLMQLPRPVGRLNTAQPSHSDPTVSDVAAAHNDANKMPPMPPQPPSRPSAAASSGPPPSHIPANFHVHDAAGRLVFPSQRPDGEKDISILAATLGAMLKEWRQRLDANKPSFPLGAARWGVLQMCIYDIWCTLEEARIWDIGLSETERLAHFYSPALCTLIGRIRSRLAQACATTLSMSQRLQFELQRWHSQWLELNENLREAQQARASSQARVAELTLRVESLEAEVSLHVAAREATGGQRHPLEGQCQRLQKENAALAQQLRTAQQDASSARARSLTLQMANEGLLGELGRWRAQAEKQAAAAGSAPHQSKRGGGGGVGGGGGGGGGGGVAEADPELQPLLTNPELHPSLTNPELQPLLTLFGSYPVHTQRIALEAILHAHDALTDRAVAEADARATTSSSFDLTRSLSRGGESRVPLPPPAGGAARVGQESAPPVSVGASSAGRLGAIEALAFSLTDDEAAALVSALSRRETV